MGACDRGQVKEYRVAKEQTPAQAQAQPGALPPGHPDTSGGSAERFLQIRRAFDVLSNPDLRRAFDHTVGAGAAQKPSPDEQKPSPVEKEEIGSFFAALLMFGIGGVILLLLGLTIADYRGRTWSSRCPS